MATDCQTVMSAIQRRTCQRMKPMPRSSTGLKPCPPMWPSTAPDHAAPAGLAQADEGDDHRAGGEEDVLDVVRDDERDHPAEGRVGERDQEQRGHRPAEVLAGDPRDDREEAGLDDREDPEVQRAPERHQDAGEDPHRAAVAPLEVLGDGEDLHLPQARDDEAGSAHEEAHRERDEAHHEGREAGDEAELGLVHVGDDPDLGREERRGADVEPHAAARHQVVLDRPDVALHAEADPQSRERARRGRSPRRGARTATRWRTRLTEGPRPAASPPR